VASPIADEDVRRLHDSGAFDPDWYRQAYPDVALTGMDPARHYLWLGAKLGRSPLPPEKYDAWLTGEAGGGSATFDLDALFIDGTNGTSSTPYRIHRIANGLTQQGWKVRCAKGSEAPDLLRGGPSARYVIFFRAPYAGPLPALVDRMRSQGSVIVFDVDDLVFDESMIPYVDAYRYMDETERRAFMSGIRAYRDFILNADLCTTTTSYLVGQIEELGKPAYRVRNAISIENIRFFEDVRYRRKGRPDPFIVGYYSGTKTHQADFAVVAPALTQFMRENRDVVFRLVGNFDLADYPELAAWQHVKRAGDLPRVIRASLMPHDAMLRDQFSCDIIIAPLEVGNPFCEAKSELKYFEAALAGCPVIASSTLSYAEACDHGRLASLAGSTDEWLAAFRDLYNDYSFALDRARQAFDSVRDIYSQRFAAEEARQAYAHFTRKRGASGPRTSRLLEPNAVRG
jgi:glycosyltransferase involved in cell wall biosynthesis